MKKQKGFTLIELLVVISIIGLLAAAGLATYTQSQKRARDAKRRADIIAIADAQELAYDQVICSSIQFQYPIVNCSQLFTGAVPKDPSTGTNYTWTTRSVDEFKVCATLETITGTYCRSNRQ